MLLIALLGIFLLIGIGGMVDGARQRRAAQEQALHLGVTWQDCLECHRVIIGDPDACPYCKYSRRWE